MRDCYFDNAEFNETSAKNADFTRCEFRGAKITGADFSGATLVNANLSGFKDDNIIHATTISDTNFDHADMRSAMMHYSVIDNIRV